MNDANTTTMLLRGARMVLPEGLAERKSLVIERDQITRIVDEGEGARARRTIDLDGLTLLPGFIDVHIHGAVGVDTMTASAEELHSVGRFLASEGVTSWLPTLVPAPNADYARAIKAIGEAMKSTVGARILGVHYEGPFVNSAQCGALRPQFFRTFSRTQDIDDLAMLDKQNAQHMMTLAPEIQGGIELVRALNDRGWILSIGHTRAGIQVLDQAREAGAHHMTHFMNAMPSLHHRDPGPVGWGLTENGVSCDVIADGIHLDPRILKLLVKIKTPDRLMLISDAIAPAGKGDGEYQIWGETIRVKDGRTSNSRGSIAGSVITMLDAVKMMLSLGVNKVDVTRMAATNPARLLRVDEDCGSIQEGKRADLVAIDDGGNVRLTIVGGSVAFE